MPEIMDVLKRGSLWINDDRGYVVRIYNVDHSLVKTEAHDLGDPKNPQLGWDWDRRQFLRSFSPYAEPMGKVTVEGNNGKITVEIDDDGMILMTLEAESSASWGALNSQDAAKVRDAISRAIKEVER